MALTRIRSNTGTWMITMFGGPRNWFSIDDACYLAKHAQKIASISDIIIVIINHNWDHTIGWGYLFKETKKSSVNSWKFSQNAYGWIVIIPRTINSFLQATPREFIRRVTSMFNVPKSGMFFLTREQRDKRLIYTFC